jgi:hypothetical protein
VPAREGEAGGTRAVEDEQVKCGARVLNMNTTLFSKSPALALNRLSTFKAMVEDSATTTVLMSGDKLASYLLSLKGESSAGGESANCSSADQVKAVMEQMMALAQISSAGDTALSYVSARNFVGQALSRSLLQASAFDVAAIPPTSSARLVDSTQYRMLLPRGSS